MSLVFIAHGWILSGQPCVYLGSDHPDKASAHRTPHLVITVLLAVFPVLDFTFFFFKNWLEASFKQLKPHFVNFLKVTCLLKMQVRLCNFVSYCDPNKFSKKEKMQVQYKELFPELFENKLPT